MKTFFMYELQTVTINGITVENAKVVTQIRTGTEAVSNELEVSEKNKGLNAVGMVYNQENDEFLNADMETEETQLDRIEANTASLKADIEQNAIDSFTLELLESGLLQEVKHEKVITVIFSIIWFIRLH